MGNALGNSKAINDWLMAPREYKIEPNPRTGPTFDPMLGFPNGRKERVMKVSKEEMENWQVPGKYRNYCANYYIGLQKCWLQNNFMSRLFMRSCDHAIHDWHNCLNEDRILMTKEYERERRLQARRKRRIAKGLEEDPSENQENMETM